MLTGAGDGRFVDFNSLLIDPDDYDSSSIIVRFRSDSACGQSTCGGWQGEDFLSGTHIGRSLTRFSELRSIRISDGVGVAAAIVAYQANPMVLYAEPNYRIRLDATPSDPQFDQLWGLHNTGQSGGTDDADIDAPEAWEITTGSASTVVAVIDTGVDYTHEDLAGNMWVNTGEVPGDGIDNDGNGFVDDVHGYDFFNNDGDPMDDNNHGTHVAGTIGAVGNNGIGVTGVNWDVQIMALKFLGADGSGTTEAAIESIDYAVANGATISNNSWGGGDFSQALYDSIENARQADHIFMAAAGNGNFLGFGVNNDVTPFWPASIDLDNIVTVAALDHNDSRAVFSNYGATSVDVGAPGVGIVSTTINNTYSSFSGTSMATPHVTGVAALMRSFHPGWSYQEIVSKLKASVDPVVALAGITVTGGRVNANSALRGPFIVSSSPDELAGAPISSLQVNFNVPINASTFSAADVNLTGPTGAIPITDVSPVAGSQNRQFEVSFPEQTATGDYSLVIGPDIYDLAGDQMDQDGDGTPGEPGEDDFTSGFTLTTFLGRFDFGTDSSQVASGYDPVQPSSSYSASLGYGWQSSPVFAVNRSGGSATTNDLSYAPELIFAVDVPTGVFDVTLTSGDLGGFAHDQMGVFFEGNQYDTLSTAAGEVITTTYQQVNVTDGQLTLRMTDLGGSDANVVLNALQVVLVPDTIGPRVISMSPDGELVDPVDRVTLTFSEPIATESFTTADVSLTGPGGTINATVINQLSGTQFEILFAEQSELGSYSVTIGPDVRDLADNQIDQDGDGASDQFSGDFSLVLFQTSRFDFGTPSSAVAPGYVRIVPASSYSTIAGYGWQSSPVSAVERSGGTASTRDLSYASELIFAVDVPGGVYDVTLTSGDLGGFAHDQMGVFLEEIQLDTLSTAAGEVVATTYQQVNVSDGQLTLRLTDLGGSDANVVLNALVIDLVSDITGPRVIAMTPEGNLEDPVNHFTLTFSEPIDPNSFTAADVSLTGPSGAIDPVTVSQSNATQFEVAFDEQSELGTYDLILGPDIRDLADNPMDQNGNQSNGESPGDEFIGGFTLTLFETVRFDFGTTSSPLEPGYVRIDPQSSYTVSDGFGWQNSTTNAIDRGTGTALTQDLSYGSELIFALDLPFGAYDVTITSGDLGPNLHDEMGLFFEDTQVDTLTTAAGEVFTNTYPQVNVTDGQLNVRLTDLGGSDSNVVLNALQVALVPDTNGPYVIAMSPDEDIADPVDHVTLTFSEPIDANSFTTADVNLTGPSGSIAPLNVFQLNATQFEVQFAEQSDLGIYQLAVGPDIRDLTDNQMDQDGDGISGGPQDHFLGSFTISLFQTMRFDFGTPSSSVEPGYLPIDPTDMYDATVGYGWQSSPVYAIERSGGTALTHDLVYAPEFDFAVDVPAGTYDVTMTIGDLGPNLHDQMAVLLEGTQVDTITTAAGQMVTMQYTQLNVTDGQLNVRLTDQGGSDSNVVLSGLEVVLVPDTMGPQVVAVSPEGSVEDPVDRVTVTFNEPIDSTSFSTGEVSITGPAGNIIPLAVTSLSETQFEVLFAEQTALGTYSVTIGPQVRDVAGNLMDQNGDGTGGQSPLDEFTGNFTLSLFENMRFDFGTASSPVETGFVQIDPSSDYTPQAGYGWLNSPTYAIHRGGGTALTTDLSYAAELIFAVDAPDGEYDVTLTIGDLGPNHHDQMDVLLEESLVGTLSTGAGQVITITYAQVSVSDGQLTLRMTDQGGTDNNVVLVGLEVVSAGASAGGASAQAGAAAQALNPVPPPSATPQDSDPDGEEGLEHEVAAPDSSWLHPKSPLVESRRRDTGNGRVTDIALDRFLSLPPDPVDEEVLSELAHDPG